ncbi:hypothetical protein [Microcystis phage Mae-JY22]
MHRPEIKAGLLLAGYNQTKLADELRVTQSAVSRVISGELYSPRIANRIAALVGRPAVALWPDLYGLSGRRRRAA